MRSGEHAMKNAHTNQTAMEPMELALPTELVERARRLANERGCSLEELLARCCAIGLELEEGIAVRSVTDQNPDLLTGLLAVLSNPADSAALEQIKRQNPTRISLDQHDLGTAVRTNVDGSVEKGTLTGDGEFMPNTKP